MSLLTTLLTLLFVAQWVASGLAQSCPSWMGMNPCSIADQLRRSSSCSTSRQPTGFQRPLNDGPTSEYQNRCICSSVYYSLVMACEVCNGRQPWPFRQWRQNCNSHNVVNGGIEGAGSFQLPSWLFLRYNDNPPDDRFDPRRAQSGAQPPQPTQPPQPPRPPPQTERPSPPQQPTQPQQPAPPSTPPAGPTQQPTQPNNPAQPQQPDTETIISTIADSSITVIVTRIVETTPSRDASNPAETNESSIVSNSNPSTNTRTRTSTLSPEQQDPNSPHYVVPNPSDDPFGLNPTSKPGGNNGPPGGSGDDASGDSRKSNNLGAIIGGIIGGLFLLLLIAGLVYFFILRRRRNRTPPSTAYMAQYGQGDGESRVTSPYPFAQAQQPQPFIPPLMNNRNSIPQSVASGSDVRPESPTLPPRVSTDARLVDVKEYGDYESVDDHAYYTRQSFTRESIGASLSGFSGISNGRSSVAGSSLGYPYRASPSPTPMEAKVVTLRYASGSQVALSPTNQSP